MPLHLETPLIESVPLSLASGRSIFLKMEALQPPGSFKIRGVGAACEHHAQNGKRRFVSSSGGNAGMAVAYAGRLLSIPVSVFVPETTTERAKSLIGQQGAEVIVHGAAWDEANAEALASVDAETAFIHPFDDPLLWTGHATVIDEVVRSGLAFDAVVLSVGGGGLFAGVAEGLRRNGLQQVPIFAVETEGTASLAASIEAGALVELASVSGIATSLGARKVSDRAFELSRTRPVESVVVSDADAASACMRFLDDHRVLVEPACGAALSLAYAHADRLAGYERVLIIACGGATTTVERLQAWQASY
ncbi:MULTISPECIES: pyridoxal-phosphate dependent enzyme [unclassified Ensifer]|uniref:pyridoxal-phosphate dependent enzyme n=1 Tax=unclassified Ensifer TaxID=2633371 RepID=UPI0008138954|nr:MULTISPECIES: pyridoxal-phosphate dependent enzyme [unclassified Ensifer]OCP01768.1 serine dehydratase [Ensifer sp. LC14]OCP09557.1 serine dehydratase [Ensifer sp. LC13]OCP10729.1 serine dehydratase [Ensifer sp. LC11]OCP32804.1 serine dehydratase [Ensifer sp. LC499]